MQSLIPPTLDPAADEGAPKTGRAIVATLVCIAILAACVVAILFIRNLSTQPAALEDPPTESTPRATRPPATPSPRPTSIPRPTPTAQPEWRTVNDGLPNQPFSARNYSVTQCGDALYLYNDATTVTRFYTLEDFRWVPEASYEAYVSEPRPVISSVYAYDSMLFVDTPEQTHVKRADGNWFSLTRLEWVDAGKYYVTEIKGHPGVDGLYALSARLGKIFRFENEAWVPLPTLPGEAIPPLAGTRLAQSPRLIAIGKELYTFSADTANGFLFHLSSNGWRMVTEVPADSSLLEFDGNLHMINQGNLYRLEEESWIDRTPDVSGNISYYQIYDGKLYLTTDQSIYRKDGNTWTPLTQGLPQGALTGVFYLYPMQFGLFLGGYDHAFYRLGANGWEKMTGEPWDANEVHGIDAIDDMCFVYTSEGIYRLYPDGTTVRIGTALNSTTGFLDIFAYQDGYIAMPFTPYICFHRAGQTQLLQEGLPAGDPVAAIYFQAGQDAYAVCETWDGHDLFHWMGDRWERVSDIVYNSNRNGLAVFGDALYISRGDGFYRVMGDQMTLTTGVAPSNTAVFRERDGELFLSTDAGYFRLADPTDWLLIEALYP